MSTPVPPRRLPRTTGGLIGSMIVVLVLVIGFVIFRSLFRDQTLYKPTRVDYLEAVTAAQGSGRTLIYPASLPKGWIADTITYDPEGKLKFGIGMLTDASDNGTKGAFVGFAEQEDSVSKVLQTYVDDDPTRGADYTASGSVATTWQTWSDKGGDHAYSATVDGHTVLVYGDAPTSDLEELVGLLTDAPLAAHSPSATASSTASSAAQPSASPS